MASSQAISSWEKNTANDPLAHTQKMYVLVPVQNIMLGLMKNSMKGISRNGDAFRYLVRKFSRVSHVKIKEGTFVGPQIKWVMNDEVLEGAKKRAWKTFKLAADNFIRRQSAKPDSWLHKCLKPTQRWDANITYHTSFSLGFLSNKPWNRERFTW
jgi:hypothetical protein